MCKLSVNINKIATLRNARGGNVPDVIQAAVRCQEFGAQGITVHPRPDQRHITYEDVKNLRPVVHTEFNIEGFPGDGFLELVEEAHPEQVTLVPDGPDVITSNAGWDTKTQFEFLKPIVKSLKDGGMRVSLFMDPNPDLIKIAADLGIDRVELYTEDYALNYPQSPEKAIASYVEAALAATEYGLGINAGHDLDRSNLGYFAKNIPGLLEVSIGHALISDSLYLGLENTIKLYLRELQG